MQKNEDLMQFLGLMFHVWDGNYRFQAWLPIIDGDHYNDEAWHFSVESIILDVDGQVESLLTALHQVNW